MSYIGNTNTTQGFVPAVDYFNGNGSTTAFTLSRPVASVAQVQAVIENVPQNPGSAFTVSGNTITFTSAPPSGTSNIYVYYTSPINQVIQPGQGTVGTAQLAGGTVSTTADITANGLTVGKGAGAVSTNTAVGASALNGNSTGSNNTALGMQTLYSNSTGYENTAVGKAALYTNTGNDNTGIGYAALLYNSSGNSNTALGAYALQANTTASYNTAVGYQAGYSNSTNTGNSFVGYQAGYSTTGSYNSFFGPGSGYLVTSGTKNTIIGGYNGNQGGLDIRTASNYIVLSDGDGTPRAYYDGASNLWAIRGNQSNGSATGIFNDNATNPSCLALNLSAASPNNSTNYFIYCYDSSSTLRAKINTNGGLANYQANNSNLSDRREKTDFLPAKNYLETICAIPVQTFKYIDQTDDDLTLGVVAQDVQAVAPELVTESNWGSEEDPKIRLSIYQTDLQYALMKAIQELKADLDATKAELAALKGPQ